jgi:hypothetical protein
MSERHSQQLNNGFCLFLIYWRIWEVYFLKVLLKAPNIIPSMLYILPINVINYYNITFSLFHLTIPNLLPIAILPDQMSQISRKVDDTFLLHHLGVVVLCGGDAVDY